MEENVKGIKQKYDDLQYEKVMQSKDDMKVRKFRFALEDHANELYRQKKEIEREIMKIGQKTFRLTNKERELLGFSALTDRK